MDMDSTESLTKYLRSKDNKVDDIVSLATKLLQNNDIFMPNKQIFIFQLLCDRVNDFNGKFTKWKLNYQVWDLFAQVWKLVSQDIKNKCFNKIRFVEIVIKIFDSKPNPQLVSSIFAVIELVKQEAIINIDENLAITLLASYLTNISPNPIYSKLIIDIYNIPQLQVNYSLGKKNYTKFILNCAQPIINLSINKLLQSANFEKLLIKILFNHDLIKHLNANISQFLSQTKLDKSEIIHLFQLIVENLKDIGQCEELFLIFTKTCHIDQLSEDLLAILSGRNKALSYQFFKTIYDQEIEKPIINWNLINYVFELDIELAIENASILYNTNAKSILHMEPLFNTILQAHVKGREIKDFYIKIWLEAITRNPLWNNSKFIDIASKSVDKFSSRQLIELIEELFTLNDSKDRVLPLFTAITKGLISSTPLKLEQVKPIILKHLNYFLDSFDDSFWEARYYLLCLYQNDAGVDKIDFNSEKPVMNRYYYYSIFRSIEIKNTDKAINNYQTNFLKYLKKDSSIIPLVLERWIVLIELFFDKKNIAEFVNIVFKNQPHVYFKQYFSDTGDIFFEQGQITSTSLDYIANNCEKESQLIELFVDFPIQCYNKFMKKKCLDVLFNISSSNSNKSKLSIRKAIVHILNQPTFQSKLESDITSLIKIIETSDDESQDVSNKICEIVWSNNMKQITNEENKKFLIESIEYLSKSLKKKSSSLDTPANLKVSSIILPVLNQFPISDDLVATRSKKLRTSFYDYIMGSINTITKSKTLDYENINWFLEALISNINNDELPTAELLDITKLIGGNIQKADNTKTKHIKRSMFKLLTRIYPVKFYDSIYILSLFFTLQGTIDTSLTDDLSHYLLRLSSERDEYIKAYEFVLSSTEGMSDENSGVFAVIITSFLKLTPKNVDESDSKLLVSSLSVVLTKFTLFNLTSIKEILLTLDTCLSTKSWMFQQFALESTITLLGRVAKLLKDKTLGESAVTLYIQASKVMSSILLFHRYKLSSRHHLIITTFVSLMEPLCLKDHNVCISNNKDTAAAYSRLLSNLCEVNSTEISKDSLSSTSTLMKKAIRKHLPLLLINYIYFNLKFNFHSIVQEELSSGIYSVLDVLSQTELQLVSSSLDMPGKSYYRTLYSTYKEHGKWKDT